MPALPPLHEAPPDDSWKKHIPAAINFYLQEVRPFLGWHAPRRHKLADVASAARVFASVRATMPFEFHSGFDDLAELCEERRQFARQVQLHSRLHAWEFVHIPLGYALLVLGVLHVVTAMYY